MFDGLPDHGREVGERGVKGRVEGFAPPTPAPRPLPATHLRARRPPRGRRVYGPVVSSFEALSRRPKFTVRRHKFSKNSLS